MAENYILSNKSNDLYNTYGHHMPPGPPYFGAAYYPEDWDISEMDFDIRKIKEFGINVIRIGEFAWSKMEPVEGALDFSWMHEVVDKLEKAGIGVILGTPTATPPFWLTKKYPKMLIELENAERVCHGGRRHACSNNMEYQKYSKKIVEALAKEFGKRNAVIGWQIDNEIYIPQEKGCFCSTCVEKFKEYLRLKFGTIENLNKRWNLNLFSQSYDDFNDILPPRSGTWHNPHLKQEYLIFSAETQSSFVRMQAEILRKYVTVPIGTDVMPFNGIDYRKMCEPLDVIQFNHYNTPENLWECCFWMDYMRTMKETPFWNTETATCWSGGTGAVGSIKPDGFCYANSWLPLALGGEANLYWLWRTHWAGHELIHGAVLDSSGRPMYSTDEAEAAAKDFEKSADFINNTKVLTDVALHFTSLNWNMFKTQEVVNGFIYDENLKKYFYKPLIDSGLRPDVIDAQADLDKYKLIFSPLMLTLEEYDLQERLADWVKNGGVWVTGPMTDIRTSDGTRYTDRLHGMLEFLTSSVWKYWIPDIEKRIKCKWNDDSDFSGNFYYELFEPNAEHNLVKITQGHKAITETSVLQSFKVGKGLVFVLGTLPDYSDMRRLIREVCGIADVFCDTTCGNSLIVSPRRGDGIDGVILVDIGGSGGSYKTEFRMKNILSNLVYDNHIEVKPYEVMILERQ